MIDYRVYLVTDNPSAYRGDWLGNVAEAVAGGVTCVQYRDTENPDGVQYERIRALQKILVPARIPLIVNNNVALALATGAAGVHVGQSDLPAAVVRGIVGTGLEIGLSITAAVQTKAMVPGAANCLGIGPVYDATKTKKDAAPPLGPGGLAEICRLTPGMPHVAIGGITLENAEGIVCAGADGLAVVSAFSRGDNPRRTAEKFRRFWK